MLALAKLSFRSGLVAVLVSTLVGVVVIPAAYSSFGEGPALARQAIIDSPEIKRDCGRPSNFILVPWNLSIEDSDSQGRLSLHYWFRCNGKFGVAAARFFHTGGGWIAQELTARVGPQTYTLLAERPGNNP